MPKTSDSPTASVNNNSPNATPSTIVTRLASSHPMSGPISGVPAVDVLAVVAPSARRLLVAERAELVDRDVLAVAHLAQVPGLDRRAVLVELPGPPRALDLLDLADGLVQRFTGQVVARLLDRLVEHMGGVVGGHRVRGRQLAVRVLVGLD